jgi:hypothetical protein
MLCSAEWSGLTCLKAGASGAAPPQVQVLDIEVVRVPVLCLVLSRCCLGHPGALHAAQFQPAVLLVRLAPSHSSQQSDGTWRLSSVIW